jgi:hypothetical protein
MGSITTAQTLRAQLMAPEPIQRVHALHALELELGETPHAAVAEELEAFAARGIPYYAPEEPAYREWVGKAVSYWEKLHAPHPVPRMTARARRAA